MSTRKFRFSGSSAANPCLRGALLIAASCHVSAHGQAAPATKANPQKANEAYLAGARLLDKGELAEAESDFLHAAALDPQRQDYRVALDLTRQHRISDLVQQAAKARFNSEPRQADELLAKARAIDPENDLVREHTEASSAIPANAAQIRRNEPITLAPPIEIEATPGAHDLHLHGDNRQAMQQAGAAYGIHVVLDDSVLSQPLRIDLDQVTYAVAIPILLRAAHLFGVVVDPKTLLVAKDTEENRAKFERQIEETIFIPGETTEQLNELINIVKNVFDVKQIASQPSTGTLVIRAPEPTLKAVNYTLADLLDGGAEVLLEVKLISIDKSRTHNLGTNTPTSLGAFNVAQEAQSIVTANQAAVNQGISQGAFGANFPTGNTANDILTEALYLVLSGVATDAKLSTIVATIGKGTFGLTAFYLGSGATANFALNTSEARALDDLNLRLGDRQQGVLKIGSRYPITTSTYSSGVSSATTSALAGKTINGVSANQLLQQYLGSGSSATVPQVQYEDLGITLKSTPTVLKSGLIKMDVDLKLESLTGQSSNNIPILTSRNFVSSITLQEGSTAVMIADMSKVEEASVSGLPGLANLPGFQESLADKMKETDSSELVMLITPRLVRRRPARIASRRIPFTSSVPAEN